MSYSKTKAAACREQVLAEPPAAVATHTAVAQCLVASAHPLRRERLADAARDGGWKAIVCADADTAWAESRRYFVQLALVDLFDADGRETQGCRWLVQQLAADAGMLVAVCGNAHDVGHEIWARQLGAWVFLPGIDARCDLAMLCSEARQIARQLAPQPAVREPAIVTSQIP
jgi:hypothetical protein